MKRQIIGLSALVIFGACAATGPEYREARSDSAPGFSEQVIEADRYRIQYRLDEDHVGKAQDFALLRAAELTMEKGFSTFEVVSEVADVTSETEQVSQVGLERDYVVTRECGLLGCSSRVDPTYTRGSISTGTVRTDEETIVTLEILLSNFDASKSARHYDASDVAANIRERL